MTNEEFQKQVISLLTSVRSNTDNYDKSEKLLEYLLSNPVNPYQLAIYKNQIFLSYRVHLSDIFTKDNQKVKENLSNLILKANEMDDYFAQNFGCEKTNFAKTT